MGKINSRAKGQRGELEAMKLLQPVVNRVYEEMGLEPPMLERNQNQTNKGGYDIIGLSWMALEIKNVENSRPGMIAQWWAQAVRQTKKGQETVLMYRRNNVPWRVRVMERVGYVGSYCVIEMSMEDYLSHFEHDLRMRLAEV